jgi:putative alpha-1,2-mannosidase
LRMNGLAIERTYLTSCELQAGGTLSFSLGSLPDRSWGADPSSAPPSASAPSARVDRCAASRA